MNSRAYGPAMTYWANLQSRMTYTRPARTHCPIPKNIWFRQEAKDLLVTPIHSVAVNTNVTKMNITGGKRLELVSLTWIKPSHRLKGFLNKECQLINTVSLGFAQFISTKLPTKHTQKLLTIPNTVALILNPDNAAPTMNCDAMYTYRFGDKPVTMVKMSRRTTGI